MTHLSNDEWHKLARQFFHTAVLDVVGVTGHAEFVRRRATNRKRVCKAVTLTVAKEA